MRALLCLLAVSCGGDTGPVALVTVEARESVVEVESLRVTASNDGAEASTSFQIGDRDFPLTFTVTLEGRTGDVEIRVEALDAEGSIRGFGRSAGAIVAGGELPLELVLDPTDFVINSGVSGSQRPTFRVGRNGRQVSAAADGSFVACFVNDCAAVGRCDVFARLFGADGAPLQNDATMSTEELVANQEEAFSSVPAVAAGDRVHFVAWETFEDVRGVALSPSGTHLAGSDTVLSAAGAMTPSDPAVAALAGGEFVAVWSETQDAGGEEIRGRLLGGTGDPVTNPVTGDSADFAVSVAPDQPFHNPTVAASGNGREFVVVWQSGGSVLARFFDAEGQPRSAGDAELLAYPGGSVVGPHVAMAPDGTAAVAAAAHVPGDSELGGGGFVFGRFQPPDGAPIEQPTVLATPAPDSSAAPAIAAHETGAFAAAWHECGVPGDGDGCAVFYQVISAEGAPVGSPEIVNTTTANDQTAPSVSATPGGFILTWGDESGAPPDTSGSAVRGRLVYLD